MTATPGAAASPGRRKVKINDIPEIVKNCEISSDYSDFSKWRYKNVHKKIIKFIIKKWTKYRFFFIKKISL